MESSTRPTRITSTRASLGALAGGLLLGAALREVEHPLARAAFATVEPLGQLWMRALQMTVVPLVVTNLLVTIVTARRGGVGRLGLTSLGVFVALLAAGGLFTAGLGPLVIDSLPVDRAAVAALQPEIPETARLAAERAAQDIGLAGWFGRLLPANLLQAVVDGELLQVLLATVLFGLAVTRLAPERRRRLEELFEALSDAVFVMVRWVLWLTPAGVFALTLGFARAAGLGAAEMLLQFVLVVSGLLVAFTLLLYPLTALAGGVGLRRLARALYPAQIVAVSTRSSLATVPALFEGGRRLGIGRGALGFVLPFSAATFKVNRTVSSTAKLLFLCHVYDLPLTPLQILAFVVTVMILSFSAVGIPGGGGAFRTLPAYVAVGIPIEGLVLVEAVDVIPDIFKTVTNSTGYLSSSAIVARLSPARASAPVATPAPVRE